jgi:hypothetical protein
VSGGVVAVRSLPGRWFPPRPWSIHLIGGRRMQHLGSIEAGAVERAVVLFGLDDAKRSLAVNLRR